jgi:hypothetical protein
VEADDGAAQPVPERSTFAFFSGGVDSFYTALQNDAEIEALVHVHGFDVRLQSTGLRTRMSRSINAAADELGCELIEVEANLRDTSDHYLTTWFYHGAFLASVAHALTGRFLRALIPASLSYGELPPLGSHPFLDPLWSSETTQIVCDGIIPRGKKLKAISHSNAAMSHLRVCWEEDTEYNCGRCPKCARTAALLYASGALERCRTLPDRVPMRALARARVRNQVALGAVRGTLAALEDADADPRLTRVLRGANRRGTLYVGFKPVLSGVAPRVWRTGARVKHKMLARRRRRRLRAAETEPGT